MVAKDYFDCLFVCTGRRDGKKTGLPIPSEKYLLWISSSRCR